MTEDEADEMARRHRSQLFPGRFPMPNGPGHTQLCAALKMRRRVASMMVVGHLNEPENAPIRERIRQLTESLEASGFLADGTAPEVALRGAILGTIAPLDVDPQQGAMILILSEAAIQLLDWSFIVRYVCDDKVQSPDPDGPRPA